MLSYNLSFIQNEPERWQAWDFGMSGGYSSTFESSKDLTASQTEWVRRKRLIIRRTYTFVRIWHVAGTSPLIHVPRSSRGNVRDHLLFRFPTHTCSQFFFKNFYFPKTNFKNFHFSIFFIKFLLSKNKLLTLNLFHPILFCKLIMFSVETYIMKFSCNVALRPYSNDKWAS